MRRKPPRTARRCTLPVTNLRAMQGHLLLGIMANNLMVDSYALEQHADDKDTRTRGIINDMRRLAKWYQDVGAQR